MKITISNTISIRKIGDELFIFDRHLSKIHNLNKVGAFIWDLIKEGLAKNETIDRIVERFDVGRNTVESDFEEFLQELQNKKIITVKSSPADDPRE